MKQLTRTLFTLLPRRSILLLAELFSRFVEIPSYSDENIKEFRILSGPAKGLIYSLPVVHRWQAASFSLMLNEIQISKLINKFCKPGSFCIDLGASGGYHTLPLSCLCGPGGKVFAFEPNPESYLILKRSIQRNKLRNVFLHSYAVADRTGEMVFTSAGSIDGLGHLVGLESDLREDSEQIKYIVQTISIDEFIEKEAISRIDLIKMDIEGAELLCLKGMKKTLQNYKPVIIGEFGSEQKIKEGIEFFHLYGYLCNHIDKNNIIAIPIKYNNP